MATTEHTFHEGDIVRRTAQAIQNAGGREDDFTVVGFTRDNWIIDDKHHEHNPHYLTLVKAALPIDTNVALPPGTIDDWTPEAVKAILDEPLNIAAIPLGDPVEHPSHYKQGGMEAIEVIEAFGLDRDFRIGNAAKYLLRAGQKDSELQDLRKARQYLNRYISVLENRAPSWDA